MKRTKGLYDFYEVPAGTAGALELRDFGDEATSRLPKWGTDATRGKGRHSYLEVADADPGFHETMGEIAGGWLGGVLASRLRWGEVGKNAGRVAGARIGRVLGSKLDGPIPESLARGVLIPNERDYPGYWGYSGVDGVGGWGRSKTRLR